MRRSLTRVLSLAMVVLGVAMFVLTLARGGRGLGLGAILGPLFVAAGAGRLYLVSRPRN